MSENGTVSKIQRSSSSRARSRKRKPKKNQLPIGFALLIVIVVIGILLAIRENNTGFYWVSGLAFGFILQKARFCFTASMRDPYLTGGTSLTRMVLVAFAITTIGFTAIKYGYFQKGLAIPGMSYVVPVSFATVIGAFMFGIGMVIAGGCASGTLMRVGEGFHMQLISLLFFVVGSLWGAHDFEWWKYNVISKGKSVFLPDVFGWFGAVAIQLGIILCLYIAAVKYEQAKTNSD